jgi:hypothetical protein
MHIGFGGQARRKETIGRFARRWEDNNKMNLRKIGWGVMDGTDLAQNIDRWRALVNTVMNLRFP